MPIQLTGLVPIRPEILELDADEQIAELAFSLWLAGGLAGDASPEECRLTAALELSKGTSAGLFAVPERKSKPQPGKAISASSAGSNV